MVRCRPLDQLVLEVLEELVGNLAHLVVEEAVSHAYGEHYEEDERLW